jgi:murein DD-endopeptidase MepM/ murein hydrolase activator NlpD
MRGPYRMNRLPTSGFRGARMVLLAAGCAAVVCGCREERVASSVAMAPPESPVAAARAAPPSVPTAAPPAADGVPAAAETAGPSAAPLPRPAVPLRSPQPTGPVFQLPTGNSALFGDNPETFYMFVDRYSGNGKVSQVWQGGGYGYVRNPRNTAHGEVFTKFHEGIDIAPVQRDAAGEPLDIVRAVADGTVVFRSANAASNYGNYLVIEHPCGEDFGSFYSLYAHLRRIDAAAGSVVKHGAPVGLMGYTGDGIDRRRAHLHLELCMMLSDRFNEFHAKHYKLPNPNGNWHGHNLIGFDVAAFLKAARNSPGLTPAEFLKTAAPYYKVRVPNTTGRELEIARRYPWLRRPGDPAASWVISYNSVGVPLAIAPNAEPCAVPAVVWVQPSPGYHSWNTRNHLGGSGSTATLAPEGTRYQQLVSGNF